MELERQTFPLLNETLNYLDIGVTGKVVNIIRNKNNKFVFNISIQKCDYINNEDINLDLLNEDYLSMSNIQPGLLLGCLHPQKKKWTRCYVISNINNTINIALCDTGEITKTKKLKNIPDRYKCIPVLTFEAEVTCIFLHGKLRHLMENFEDYVATFESFVNNSKIKNRKKMKLIYKDSSLDFIIKQWDPQNYINIDDLNYNSLMMFENGSSVILAKVESYDWRHIFIRSVDKFVNISNELQTYCENSSSIQKYPIVGDIVAVKCTDKFYRCKIIDILDHSYFYLYLIDAGYIISANIDSIVDLSESLKEIPPTVCLIGLKDVPLKPWTPEIFSFITKLFENSTAMIMEYNDYDPFGLDSVTLTITNNYEDVNGHIKQLLTSVEDNQHNICSNSVNDINPFIKLQSYAIMPVRVENMIKSDNPVMTEYDEIPLPPGSAVYMTSFVDLNEIYIRKIEDHNDEFENFLDKINSFCLSADSINRTLVIGEIVGARSTLDNSFYRGKVLKQIDDITYLIHYIDFGDKDNVPKSNIFDIPKDFMIPSNVIKISLNGVMSRPLNTDTMNYVNNLLSNYEPMIVNYSPTVSLQNVILKTVIDKENVNDRLNELLKDNTSTSLTNLLDQLSNIPIISDTLKTSVTSDISNIPVPLSIPNTPVSSSIPNTPISSSIPNTPVPPNTPKTPVPSSTPKIPVPSSIPKTQLPPNTPKTPVSSSTPNTPVTLCTSIIPGTPNTPVHVYENLPKLKNGDLVYITIFIDVHQIFVRKVDDENDEFYNFIENVNSYCSAVPPIGKLPKLNDIIGAKSIDGLFYRAKVVKKISDVSYNVQFIDYGMEENVNLSDIVTLSTELIQFIPSIIKIKLKDVPFSILNEAARKYVSSISENEILIINTIDDKTNEVILTTEKKENINDYINMLISGSINEHISNETDYKFELDCNVQSLENNITFLQPGNIVYMTSFDSLEELYIRKLEDYNDEFHVFLDKVNEFCLSATSINRPLIIGEIIGAKSILDDGFYRGKVLKQIDDTNYLIHYIDFGNKDKVSISNIFEIPNEYKIPSTVIKVILKGIISSSVLSVEASNYISNLLSTYAPMTIDFDLKFPLKGVNLVVINTNENVAENLNKLIKNVSNATTNNELKNICVTEHTKSVVFQNLVTDKTYDIINTLKNGDLVYITAYIDLCSIFVRKIDDTDEFQKLSERVNTYCSLGNTSEKENKPLELNQIVGAKYSADGCFYRARIIDKVDDNNYNAIFIDFGFEDSVNFTDIIFLPNQLQQATPSVTLVGLKGSNFENLSLEDHKYLEQLLLLSEVLKIEFEDLHAVTLTVVSQGINIIDYLNELHIDDMKDNTIINDSMETVSDNLGMKYISSNISIPQIPPLTNKSIVTIHTFLSLRNIFIKVPFQKFEVDKFIKDFSIFCLTLQPINRKPLLGEIFGIRSSIDGLFYRGTIKDILNGNQFSVILFDLGTEDIVSINSIVEIPDNLKQIPQSIYSVGLRGFNSENCNAQAMSYVNMLCDNIPLIIEFDENSPNGLNAVTLITVKTQQNVNDHLSTLLNEKERDSPETVQGLSKGDIVYISSFIDLQNLYVRRINNNTDRFKSFLENFSSSCAFEKPIAIEPKIGEIIAAKEKNGTKFYRAEIISKVDNEHFGVCFIDFGSRDTIHKNNIVKPSETELQNCPPTFLVGLDELDSEPVKPIVLQYIKKISQTETFIVDSINNLFKVILISVNTQCNINKELEKRIAKSNLEPIIQKGIYTSGDFDSDIEKSVIQYHKLPLEVPTQVWIAEKISSSKYSVHTYNSRIEFIRLEKLIFEDSKILEPVKFLKINMPCVIYVSPCWYRGEILEIIDTVSAKVTLIDLGSSSVIRNNKEIFCMPSKYIGKSLLLTIDILPEPQEKLSIMSFKVIAKKHLENSTIVEIVKPVDQSYGDLENVGLPSFSSTPIHEDSEHLRFLSLNEEKSCTTLCPNSETNSIGNRNTTILTLKDVQNVKWPKGSTKTLIFLCVSQDYFVMRDYLVDNDLRDLETKIQKYCLTNLEPYSPVENELCLAKYSDEMWYRAICMKTSDKLNGNNYLIYFLDWGIEYLVNITEIYKMSKEFIFLPAAAHKCYVSGVDVLKWSNSTLDTLNLKIMTPMPCEIVDKLSNESYTIKCEFIKHLDDTNKC